MAASDSYVPNLYADSLVSRANGRGAAYGGLIRTLASIGQPVADFVAASLSILFVYSVSSGVTATFRQRAIASIAVGIVAAIARARRQEPTICNLIQIRETEAIIRSAVLSQLSFLCVNLLLGSHLSVRAYVLSVFAIASSMMLMREVITRLLRWIHGAGYGAHSVVIYGHPETAKQIASAMLRSPSCGLHPVAMIHDESVKAAEHIFRSKEEFSQSIPVSSGPLTTAKLDSSQCSLVLVAAPYLSRDEIEMTTGIARGAGAPVALLSAALEDGGPLEQIEVNGLHLVTGLRTDTAWHADLLKRSMDLTIALLLLILGSPVFLLIALCIKLDSRGPVLFVQKRVGRNGGLFNIFKFRSMYAGSPMYEASPTMPTDPRITRVGRILRRTGLDETAQLLNVLLGQMSLVGPRPEMPFLVERYIRNHRPRLHVTPGITGLWQLSPDRAFPIHQNPHYDLFYIRHRSCCMDAAILLHTLLFAMRGGV